MTFRHFLFSFILACVCCVTTAQKRPIPTIYQLNWQKNETAAFLHFGINTFTNREWGEGNESPAMFNPTHLDTRQWVKSLKDAGFKTIIITAKHHDGFCLWPSAYTEHSIKNSPYKNGKGDILKELSHACRKANIKIGFYLSPWDMHEPTYGSDGYNDFYKNQLMELLTNYGEISEIWFDGARGPNAKNMKYDFEGFWSLIRKLQPKAVLFSDAGPDVRWVGNENGNAGETCWSMINAEGMSPGVADEKYLNVGDPSGKSWIPAETDVSIRPGWFYHDEENAKVRTPQNLVNLYYQSVGRNSVLLLNLPPNREGQLSEIDVKMIKEYRSILDETFKKNLARGSSERLTDQKLETYVPISRGFHIELQLKEETTFDRMLLQENIINGQSVSQFKVEYLFENKWIVLKESTTIGYKRLLRFDPVTTARMKITIQNALTNDVQLAEIGLYKASAREISK